MRNIVALDDTKKRILAINVDETSQEKTAELSIDSGATWNKIAYSSILVQDNLFRFKEAEDKQRFFKDHIGHKIRVDTGIPKGWLIIKSLENITLRPFNEDIFYSINYADISYQELEDNNVMLSYNLVRKQPIDVDAVNKSKYEDQFKSAEKNRMPIKPMDYNKK